MKKFLDLQYTRSVKWPAHLFIMLDILQWGECWLLNKDKIMDYDLDVEPGGKYIPKKVIFGAEYSLSKTMRLLNKGHKLSTISYYYIYQQKTRLMSWTTIFYENYNICKVPIKRALVFTPNKEAAGRRMSNL